MNFATIVRNSCYPFRSRCRSSRTFMASTQAQASADPPRSPPSSSSVSSSLTRLHSQLHVYRPASSSLPKSQSPPLTTLPRLQKAASPPPRVILLLGWMDAPLRLLTKYAQPYAELFPHSTIVIQLSNGQAYLQGGKAESLRLLANFLRDEAHKEQSRSEMRREMEAIEQRQVNLRLDEDAKRELRKPDVGDSTVTLVEKEESDGHEDTSLNIPPWPTGLLIHSFSDGGASNLHYLLGHLRDDGAAAHAALLPIRATIFDSSPSAGTPIPGATAFTMPLLKSPRWLVRVVIRRLVRAVLIVYLYALWALRKALARKSRHEVFRTSLNDAKSWQRETLPPRLYLYSQADALVPYKAVEAHARHAAGGSEEGVDFKAVEGTVDDDAPTRSPSIRMRRWKDAPHCSMARVDSDRYWHHVGKFLQDALD